MLVFTQGMDANFQLTKEILSVESLNNNWQGLVPSIHAIENCIARTRLEWTKMACVRTDGARSLQEKM